MTEEQSVLIDLYGFAMYMKGTRDENLMSFKDWLEDNEKEFNEQT